MIFEQIATGGCQSYFIACGETCTAAVIDPEVRQLARYQALATQYAHACGPFQRQQAVGPIGRRAGGGASDLALPVCDDARGRR
jgi:hypothetical protein